MSNRPQASGDPLSPQSAPCGDVLSPSPGGCAMTNTRDMSSWDIGTRAVHAGERGPKPNFTPVATPIYRSSAYMYDEIAELDAVFGGQQSGYVYARYGNPTITALE